MCQALFGRVSDRESLREFVRFAQAEEHMCTSRKWRSIPRALWDDKALCLELLAMLPILYGCLPNHLQSDADVVAALMTAKPEH